MGKKNKTGFKAKGKSNIELSLYEVNQNIISQLPAYDQTQINKLEDDINTWEPEESQYFMFLCKDISYYTILHRTPHDIAEFPDLGQTISHLIKESNWTIHSDENCDDHYEVWVKTDENVYDFLLFPYDTGVVNYG